MFSAAGCGVHEEVGLADGKRMDLVVDDVNGREVFVDVTVVGADNISAIAAGAAKVAGAAGRSRERVKHIKYDDDMQGTQLFVPFVVESFGALGTEALRLVKDVAKQAYARGRTPTAGGFVWYWTTALSVGLQRAHARTFATFTSRMDRLCAHRDAGAAGFYAALADGGRM